MKGWWCERLSPHVQDVLSVPEVQVRCFYLFPENDSSEKRAVLMFRSLQSHIMDSFLTALWMWWTDFCVRSQSVAHLSFWWLGTALGAVLSAPSDTPHLVGQQAVQALLSGEVGPPLLPSSFCFRGLVTTPHSWMVAVAL